MFGLRFKTNVKLISQIIRESNKLFGKMICVNKTSIQNIIDDVISNHVNKIGNKSCSSMLKSLNDVTHPSVFEENEMITNADTTMKESIFENYINLVTLLTTELCEDDTVSVSKINNFRNICNQVLDVFCDTVKANEQW